MSSESSSLCARFGQDLFHFDTMKQCLSEDAWEKLNFAIRNHRPLSPETADAVAQAMKDWAIRRGATHYAHWFQPLTGTTARKHNSFLVWDGNGRVIDRFTGSMLIANEAAEGGMMSRGDRSTFEARGFLAWDPTSPAFLSRREKTCTLFIPSVFTSPSGAVLDKKTPLLISTQAVSQAAVRMLRLLGNKRVTGATAHVGPEQEYFLIDAAHIQRRPDLRAAGLTLLGAGPNRGQLLEDHYMRAIPSRALAYMDAVTTELVGLGVPVKTRHNEAAPAQFEIAVLHAPANIAVDQNQLVMETLRLMAPDHGFEVLMHEKPFAGVNGSAKHVNWSLIDSEGTNLLSPGIHRAARIRFFIFLMAVVAGVRRHSALLRGIIAGAGNELRLGAHEAPPIHQYIHLGPVLNGLLEGIAEIAADNPAALSDADLGLDGSVDISSFHIDDHRTSPIAFTGQKVEFRSIGASAGVSFPVSVMNAMVAESLDLMATRMEKHLRKTDDRIAAAVEMLREFIIETRDIRFDGAAEEWPGEASHKGVRPGTSSPEAFDGIVLPSSIKLFARYEMMTEEDARARYQLKLESYRRKVLVELRVFRQMLSTGVLPAAYRHQATLAGSIERTIPLVGTKSEGLGPQIEQLKEVASLIGKLIHAISQLDGQEKKVNTAPSVRAAADICAKHVRPLMREARQIADRLELLIDDREWPFAHYDEMLSS